VLKSRHLVYQVKLNRKNLRKKRSLVLAASFQDNRGKLISESPASLDFNATRDKTATDDSDKVHKLLSNHYHQLRKIVF